MHSYYKQPASCPAMRAQAALQLNSRGQSISVEQGASGVPGHLTHLPPLHQLPVVHSGVSTCVEYIYDVHLLFA